MLRLPSPFGAALVPGADQFDAEAPPVPSLTPGQTQTLSVSHAPTRRVAASATLLIDADDGVGPVPTFPTA